MATLLTIDDQEASVVRDFNRMKRELEMINQICDAHGIPADGYTTFQRVSYMASFYKNELDGLLKFVELTDRKELGQ